MCDAAGQASDGFHFLCLAKLFFEQLALADILRNHQMDGAACIFQLVSDDFGIDHFSIFANVLPVSLVLLVALRLANVLEESALFASQANVQNGHTFEFRSEEHTS